MATELAQTMHVPAVRAGGRRISITRKAKRTPTTEIEEIEDVTQTQDYPRPTTHDHQEHDEKEGYKNRRERRKSSNGKQTYEPAAHMQDAPAYAVQNKRTMQIKQPAGRGLN